MKKLYSIDILQKKLFIIYYFVFSSFSSFSQNYFQQEVNYKINVRLEDEKNYLYADETIEYINNSPDTLHFIYFHLWPNAYKNSQTAFAIQNLNIPFLKKKITDNGFIDGLDFKVDNQTIEWKIDDKNIDICKLILKNPLLPNQKITISTPFYVKIPENISRLGYEGQSYQISQWYPKPAVYDVKGWHEIPYLDMGEFYSEYGSFDVSITVPKNYVVAATGNLQTKSEIHFLDSLANLNSKNSKISNNVEFPKSEKETKTIRFTEKNIHDFAWFADKRYNVLKGDVVLPNSNDTVTTWSFYTNLNAKTWRKSLEYVNDAVYNYSLWLGNYPYKNCTAVEGGIFAGGGMEYPTITVIGNYEDAFDLESVIMHEVGHNWFYGIFGSNERDNPWMDEGLNSFYELRYIEKKYPGKNMDSELDINTTKMLEILNFPYRKKYELGYQFNARRNLDQECTLNSNDFAAINYQLIVYSKNAFIFNYLKNYLGEMEFDRIMKIYFEKWKFKHPQPEDFIKLFKENSKENLSWFFDDVLQTRKRIDYKISSLHKNELKVKNLGQIQSPFNISLLKNDSLVNSFWNKSISKKEIIQIPNFDFDKIVIDYEQIMPDINKRNNYIYKSGIFKKRKQLALKYLASFENPEKNTIYFTPVIGFNFYDKIMPGILIYNSTIPIKKLEYFIMPMFSFGQEKLNGEVKVDYNIFPYSEVFQYITPSISGARYSLSDNSFYKLKAELDIKFRVEPLNKNVEKRIIFNHIFVSNIENLIYNDTSTFSNFNNLKFIFSKHTKQNPYSIFLNLQGNQNFVKSSMEANYKFSYKNNPKKGIEIRLFAGKFLYNSTTNYGNYNFSLSGHNGENEYAFENVFFARGENVKNSPQYSILAQQFVKNDGGFVYYSHIGQTPNWLTTLGISLDFPHKLPLKVYANFGTYAVAGSNSYSKKITFETGIGITIVPKIFEIYLPLKVSKDLTNNAELNNLYKSYSQKIRFILNINQLNPFKFAKDYNP
jgi:hypothetical protein